MMTKTAMTTIKKLTISAAIAAVLAPVPALAFWGSDTEYTRAEYGAEWPFTVDTIEVGCDAMAHPYVETEDRAVYGITGKSLARGYPNVSAIHIKGKDLGPFIEAALEECPSNR